jgi:hypothetical protein
MLRVYIGVRDKFKGSKFAQVFGGLLPHVLKSVTPTPLSRQNTSGVGAIKMHRLFQIVDESTESP